MSFAERATQRVRRGRLPEVWLKFRHGFLQLVLTFRALHSDALAWKRYLRVCCLQAVVTLALGSVSLSTARNSSEGLREERVRRALEAVSAVEPRATAEAPPTKEAVPAEKAPPPATGKTKRSSSHHKRAAAKADQAAPSTGEATDTAPPPDKAAEARADFQQKVEELKTALVDLSSKAGETAIRRDSDFQEARQSLDEQLTELENDAEGLQLSAEDKATLVRLGAELDVLEKKTKPGFWDSAWALALSIYGSLSVAQAIVIALSRDFQAAIARDASLLLGVAPEDPPSVPRIRLNVAWVRRKFQQRKRSLFVFLPGVALISLAALPFPQRTLVTSVLTTVWAAYWWVVWTASKSARAWERDGVASPPFFLRWWHAHLGPLPVVGAVARLWERLWARLTRPVFSPAEAVEAQPAEFSGLAAARALQLVPVVKLFVRPLVPVAAARLLAERSRAGLRLESPKEQAVLAAQRAAVPASPGALAARDQM